MLVLAIETATDVAGVALADESGLVAAASLHRGRRHGESVAPAVAFVLERAGATADDLGALAVDVGPGLFTGLRVGVATAKALAFALELPVVAVTSLELLALGAAAAAAAPPAELPVVVPVVDARRGQLFAAEFRVDAAGDGAGVTLLGEEGLVDPEPFTARLAAEATGGRRVLCVGDGALRYREQLAAVPGLTVAGGALAHPDPGVLALAGVARAVAGDAVAGRDVVARYLRQADVRINWEQRQPARPGAGAVAGS